MNVLIDTNVCLDLLLKREQYYQDAARISVLSENGYMKCYVSASAVTDIFYIIKKELKNVNAALGLIKSLLRATHIATVTENCIHEALDLNWNDFEDCVQYVAGQYVSAEYIITRNPGDFTNSQINVITPEEFIKQIILRRL